MNYILDENDQPVEIFNILRWAQWMADNSAYYRVNTEIRHGINVSTFFLGIDHGGIEGTGRPILWETVVFGGIENGYRELYHTKDEAIAGHKQAVEMVRQNLKETQ